MSDAVRPQIVLLLARADNGVIGSDGLPQRFTELADDIVLIGREDEIGDGDLAGATEALGAHAGMLRGFIVNEA